MKVKHLISMLLFALPLCVLGQEQNTELLLQPQHPESSVKESLQKAISAYRYDFSTVKGKFLRNQIPYILEDKLAPGPKNMSPPEIKLYETTIESFEFSGTAFSPELYRFEDDEIMFLMFFFSEEEEILSESDAILLCKKVKEDMPKVNVIIDSRLAGHSSEGTTACQCFLEELGKTKDDESYLMSIGHKANRVYIQFFKY